MKYSVVKPSQYEGIFRKGWWTIIDNDTSLPIVFTITEKNARVVADMLNRDEGNVDRGESLANRCRRLTDDVGG